MSQVQAQVRLLPNGKFAVGDNKTEYSFAKPAGEVVKVLQGSLWGLVRTNGEKLISGCKKITILSDLDKKVYVIELKYSSNQEGILLVTKDSFLIIVGDNIDFTQKCVTWQKNEEECYALWINEAKGGWVKFGPFLDANATENEGPLCLITTKKGYTFDSYIDEEGKIVSFDHSLELEREDGWKPIFPFSVKSKKKGFFLGEYQVYAHPGSESKDHYVYSKKKDLWGFIDSLGKITPLEGYKSTYNHSYDVNLTTEGHISFVKEKNDSVYLIIINGKRLDFSIPKSLDSNKVNNNFVTPVMDSIFKAKKAKPRFDSFEMMVDTILKYNSEFCLFRTNQYQGVMKYDSTVIVVDWCRSIVPMVDGNTFLINKKDGYKEDDVNAFDLSNLKEIANDDDEESWYSSVVYSSFSDSLVSFSNGLYIYEHHLLGGEWKESYKGIQVTPEKFVEYKEGTKFGDVVYQYIEELGGYYLFYDGEVDFVSFLQVKNNILCTISPYSWGDKKETYEISIYRKDGKKEYSFYQIEKRGKEK